MPRSTDDSLVRNEYCPAEKIASFLHHQYSHSLTNSVDPVDLMIIFNLKKVTSVAY